MGTDFGKLSQNDKNDFLNSMGVKGKRASSKHKALKKAQEGGIDRNRKNAKEHGRANNSISY